MLRLGTLQSCHITARSLGQSTWTGEHTGPAWDSELAPTTAVYIMPLTQYLCAFSLDDCKNIANIMKTLAHRGFIFKQTSKPF